MSEAEATARDTEMSTTSQAERRKARRHELWLKALDIIGRLAEKALGQ